MLKKIVLLAFLCIPFGMIAQDAKIAYVNPQEIWKDMPELSEVESKLATERQKIANELKSMEDELNRLDAYLKQNVDSLLESIKATKEQELQTLYQRYLTFQETGRQEMTKKEQELLAPIEQKIANAIKSVGEEQGYTFILHASTLLYTSPKAIDATPLVRTKLGIK